MPESPMPGEAPTRPRPGVRSWRNSGNGAFCVQLHYTADPRKREKAWAAAEKPKNLPRNWAREYEIAWTVPEGEPVIPEYEAATHERPLRIDPTLRLLRFWDFGFDSPVCLFAQQSKYGQLRFIRELSPFNIGLRDFAHMVVALSVELVGAEEAARAFDAGDPEANSNQDLGMKREVLEREFGIHLATARPGTEVSYDALRARFVGRVFVPGIGHEPLVVVDPKGCPNLASALQGAFHRTVLPPYRPKREHPWTDCVDAARYGNDNLTAAAREYRTEIAKMATIDRIDFRGMMEDGRDESTSSSNPNWMFGGR
jgi:hypothetical protein